jgi:TPP-dependent pyruvate/acetoin dehydrogenase alpha subunit
MSMRKPSPSSQRDALLEHLGMMHRIRFFEEKVLELRLAGPIVGSVHLCNGQEAISVGARAALEPQDAVFATYRGHGYALACGVPPEKLFAELLGRASGVNGGRGGSAYFSAPEWGFYGENSIVGAGAPIALGAALAARYDGSNRVALTAFGDGALNQGAVHEAMNMASAFNLPVIFLCENNIYSELTPIKDMVRSDELYKRASAYAMPGERIDGNDPEVVREAVSKAVQLARNGGGPSLIEAMTERLVGHYIGDAETYRPAGEVEAARGREPITRARARLQKMGVGPEPLDALAAQVLGEIQAAAENALNAPLADAARVREHLYA